MSSTWSTQLGTTELCVVLAEQSCWKIP